MTSGEEEVISLPEGITSAPTPGDPIINPPVATVVVVVDAVVVVWWNKEAPIEPITNPIGKSASSSCLESREELETFSSSLSVNKKHNENILEFEFQIPNPDSPMILFEKPVTLSNFFSRSFKVLASKWSDSVWAQRFQQIESFYYS